MPNIPACCFTRDPSAAVLRWSRLVARHPEKPGVGMGRPHSFRFGRVTKKPFGKDSAPIDLRSAAADGDVAERLFRQTTDMEWAYREGTLPSGAEPRHHPSGRRRMRHGAKQTIWPAPSKIAKGAEPDQDRIRQNELSEMLPAADSAVAVAHGIAVGSRGSVDLAARELGLGTLSGRSTYLVTILGRLYVNKREQQARALVTARSPRGGCCVPPIASSATSASTSCRSSSARPVC